MDDIKPKIVKSRMFSFRTIPSIGEMLDQYIEKNFNSRQEFFEKYFIKQFLSNECDFDLKLKG